jgi:hypothetical protein
MELRPGSSLDGVWNLGGVTDVLKKLVSGMSGVDVVGLHGGDLW